MAQPADILHRMVEELTAQPEVRPVRNVSQGDIFTEVQKLEIEYQARKNFSGK